MAVAHSALGGRLQGLSRGGSSPRRTIFSRTQILSKRGAGPGCGVRGRGLFMGFLWAFISESPIRRRTRRNLSSFLRASTLSRCAFEKAAVQYFRNLDTDGFRGGYGLKAILASVFKFSQIRNGPPTSLLTKTV